MKICYITRDYRTEIPWNGVSTYVSTIASILAKRGHEIHIICQAKTREKKYTKENIHIHAITPYQPSYYNKNYKNNIFLKFIDKIIGRILYTMSFNIKSYYIYQDIQKTRRCDILESEDGGGAGLLPTFDKKTPVITFLHTPWTLIDELNQNRGVDRMLIKILEKQQLKRSNHVNANSFSIIKKISKLFDIKLNSKVIRYPINISDINLKADKKSPISGKYLLYYGAIEKRKGIITLVKAMQGVFLKDKIIKLVIIGNEPINTVKENSLKEHALKELSKNSKRIIFLPQQEPNKIFSIVKKSSCVVLPSIWEAFGYTCLESMALGKIVIATSGSGFEEQIKRNGKNGYLFEPENHKELAKKILYVLKLSKKEKKKIEDNAKKRAKEFDNKIIINKIIEHYMKIATDYEK